MLLVVSGLEENPGPAQHTLEDHPVEDWEFAEVVTEMDDLKTKRTKCAVCAVGDLRPDLRSEQSMIVYTRNGPRRVKHVPMRCNNRNPECRAYHGYGFYQTKSNKIFEDDALRNKVLITSAQTGFEIDYLVEISASVEINSDAFEGLAKVYNRQPTSNSNCRQKNRGPQETADRCLFPLHLFGTQPAIWC